MSYAANLKAVGDGHILQDKEVTGHLIFVNIKTPFTSATVPFLIEEEPADPRLYDVDEVFVVHEAWDGQPVRLRRSACGLGCMCGVEFA